MYAEKNEWGTKEEMAYNNKSIFDLQNPISEI